MAHYAQNYTGIIGESLDANHEICTTHSHNIITKLSVNLLLSEAIHNIMLLYIATLVIANN